MEEGAGTASPLWNWDYLDRCFAHRRVCISFGLWICSACCWIAAHALTLYLRCTKKCGQDQSTLCATFCLLTSLCDTVGAILARQLTIQVFTGAYLAVVDFVNFVSILFPVCGSKSKSKSGRGSRERRRRHLRASVFALALPLCLGPGWAIWAAVPKASVPVRGPQRKLLGSLLQENLEVFGYLLGGIAAIGSWASRIPPFSKIIIFLSCVVKSKMRQAFGFAAKAREGPDTQALLTCTEKEDSQEARTEDQNSDWVPLTSLSHCKPLRTMTAVSRYMELTVEPVQQAGCSATRLPGDGQTSTGDASLQEPPSYPPIQVIQARVSSGSSSEVSSINSDLEQKYWEALNSEQWDPEDVNLERNKNNVESLRSQMHKGSLSPVDLTSDN
ncbi:transmembrane protein 44 isoform X4 [Cricetulus griseus]|uniref:Transmembrane protein 44 isoform X4 n=1 Tax=Cricetulus griseus TaxID=10029 RepID=A0A9J7JL27_CRIGR|nr:transmembrane protein 44 isoform X4 [Cricetulus griseus]XP_027268699.1 transmembrane protein 44 isoform X4 [Cricetulus griseus]